MYAVERYFTTLGPDGFAKLMATRLRDPEPRREILHAIARLLDPRPDDDLRLVVERRSRGTTKMRWTKRAEQLDIVSEVLDFQIKYLESGKPPRGSQKKAVGEIAAKRGIKPSTVYKALKVQSLIPK